MPKDIELNSSSRLYEGCDDSVIMTKRCRGCHKDSDKLLRCSRCQVVYYCSRQCQTDDFLDHKKICKRIHRHKKDMETEAEALRSFSEYNEPPTNLFITSAGQFWRILETRDYMRARLRLSNAIYTLASKVEPSEAPLWEAVIYHEQEMLRLSDGDNLGMRKRFPFLLLEVNRDDDATCFVYFWMKRDDTIREQMLQVHLGSSEGDWLYPKEKDARFLDIFHKNDNIDMKNCELSSLVALATIKMRLVMMEKSHLVILKEFKSTTLGSMVDPVSSVIEGMLPGSDPRLEGQRDQLDRLLDIIDRNNPTMLPSILNPDPLLCQEKPDSYSTGSPSEAYFVLLNADRVWCRIPGAMDFLEKRFGKNPIYNSSL